MSSLSNKRILLGVTGGIAAYKAADLTRKLIAEGAEVQVVMTRAAQEFVGPLTFQALSGNPVHTSLLDEKAEAAMGHIELARWADLLLIAPASADFISKLAHGEGSDLLSTVSLATAAPVAVAPAMNQQMWLAEATQSNLETIRSRSFLVFGPASGEQACGDVGYGRMLETEELVELCAAQFKLDSLSGKHLVITAGPTVEAIDPVRFISNHSSGKMGYALAQAAVEAGAKCTLVTGPVNINTPDRVECIRIESAEQMLDASIRACEQADVFIAAAAVSDYRPLRPMQHKIKKTEGSDSLKLELVKNPDVLATVAAQEKRPFCVGFAAETQNVKQYALAKLEKKKLDMIIANDVSDSSIGFNSDQNAVSIFDRNGDESYLDSRSKTTLARDLIALISQRVKSQSHS